GIDFYVRLSPVRFFVYIFLTNFGYWSPIFTDSDFQYERRRLTLISLAVFLAGNLVTVFSPTYTVVFIGRVISALSGALLIILCLTIAPSIVHPKYRGRAIGIVSMGASASIVLGFQVGLLLGIAFGWS